MATHLVAFYTATAGDNGTHLGSDEEDIVIVQYLIWEIRTRKILREQQYIAQVSGSEVNENVLSEECREAYGLTEAQVRDGQSLDAIIESFDVILSKIRYEGGFPILITDGQLHLRQVLHPKSVAKGIELPDFYYSFYDLRKEFKSFFHTTFDIFSTRDMLQHIDLEQIRNESPCLAQTVVRDMVTIMDKMVGDGHRFTLPEAISSRLEPGICTRGEEVDSSCVVRARGLPWQSSDQDIAKFFRGLNIAKGGVALCLSLQGRRNGEALVRFVSAEHRDMALKRHKHHIGNRYIEVYKATGEDFINVAGGNNNEAQQFLSRGGQVIIRMRGLPYDCTAKQVVEFFETGENGCEILDGEDGVLFVRKPDGRATGDAFVLFSTEEDSAKALSKHREIIGSRYIELFRSTTAEVQQVLNRSMDPRTHEPQQPLIPHLPQMPVISQQMQITSGTRKDCIRLRGLPYEAQVEHVLEFLGDHAKNIVFRGVHMVINAQGQPSGEAFIQMDSEHSAFLAAQNRHHRNMVFGKKQRYIEVFQCSGEDMNVVLSGGVTAAQRAVVSHGMFLWDQNTGTVTAPIAQGAATPTYFHAPAGAPRPPFANIMVPPFPQTISTAPNGTLMPGIMPNQIKPDSVVLKNHLMTPSPAQVRPSFLPPPSFEIPAVSQAQTQAAASAVFSNAVKGPTPNTVLYTHLPCPELNLAAPTATPGGGLVFLPGSKVPGVAYSASFPPQISYTNVSSPDRKTNPMAAASFQPKYTIAPLVPVNYTASQTAGLTAAATNSRLPVQVPLGTKRSFDQAFTGDKSSVMQIKRTNRASTPQLATHMTPTYVNSHLATPQLQPAQLAAAAAPTATAAPQAMSAVHMAPPMIPPPLYPSAQLYPPAM